MKYLFILVVSAYFFAPVTVQDNAKNGLSDLYSGLVSFYEENHSEFESKVSETIDSLKEKIS